MSWLSLTGIASYITIAMATETFSIEGIGKLLIDFGALGILAFLLWFDRAKTMPNIVRDHKDACDKLSSSIDRLTNTVDKSHQQNFTLIQTLIETKRD